MTTGSCCCNCEQAKMRSGSAKRFYEQDFSFCIGLARYWPGRGSGRACHPLERDERIAQSAFGIGRILHCLVLIPGGRLLLFG